MSRGWSVAASVLLWLPLLLVSLVVSASTGNPIPGVFALAGLAALLRAAWAGRGWWYAPLPGVALFVVLAGTVLDSTVIEREAQLRAARFGVPFDYVEAELSASPPLPYRSGWNPWEDPARLLPGWFLVSYGLVLGGLGLIALLFRLAYRRRT